MKKKLVIVVLTVVAFIFSFGLAQYFAGNRVQLPSLLSQTIFWFESSFKKEEILQSEVFPNKKKVQQQASDNHYSHNEVGKMPTCRDTSLGKVKYKKVGNIYTWTDDNDVYHVSDKPPDEGQFELISYAGDKVFDYFNLNLNTENLPYDFNQKLTVKLNKLFELYGNLLDRDSLKKTDINLRVFKSKTAFKQVKKQHNMPSGNKSNGFYSHSNNQAYLLFINNDRTMITAIHEATHAINRAIIGYTPRWLNEGLAEYSENIKVNGNLAVVYPNKSWTKKNVISKELLSLKSLFSASASQWNSDLRQRLYATSWAFVYYMMENSQRKSVLAKLIKIEQQNLCNVSSLAEFEKKLEIRLSTFQNQFTLWSIKKLRRQSI